MGEVLSLTDQLAAVKYICTVSEVFHTCDCTFLNCLKSVAESIILFMHTESKQRNVIGYHPEMLGIRTNHISALWFEREPTPRFGLQHHVLA